MTAPTPGAPEATDLDVLVVDLFAEVLGIDPRYLTEDDEPRLLWIKQQILLPFVEAREAEIRANAEAESDRRFDALVRARQKHDTLQRANRRLTASIARLRAEVAAAEQRGAERALREAADNADYFTGSVPAPVIAAWLRNRAAEVTP